MFSSIMETVLVKFLGKYVDGIKNNMDVNIINGNVTVQKISLRPQFINQLGLPFLLKYSHISKILINVPWTSLKQKPTTITVQGIYVLLALKYDDMEEIQIDPKDRMKHIISRVKQQLKKKWEEKDASKSESFAEKSIIRIIDNMVISIDQIHVRIQSIQRGWDFSFGLLMDRISSFTVNQYGQKTFYTRHFTNKQANPPLKKAFTCQRFQIYFNDKEQFFMSLEQGKNKQQTIKALLAQPFASKSVSSPNKKEKGSLQKMPTLDTKQSYQMKILTRFTFDIIVQQKLSADQKYVVQVKGELPKIVFQISDIQLSQMIVVLQLIYEWIIDKQKNGRKNNTFDEKTQQYFKSIVLKLAKEDKITDTELKDLYNIALVTSINKLEGAADNLIKDYRIEKQMKKINKVANKDKSKELMEKLFDRMENQNQQIVQLFEHIVIQLCIPEFKLSCMKGDQALIQAGFSYIKSDVKLVLTKHTYVSVHVTEVFIKQASDGQQQNLVILDKPEYSVQPFIQFGLTQLKKSPPVIKTTLKKRYFLLNEETISHLITWVSCVRMKPPLVNFLDEQLNYSIYITQQIFYMLFSHGQSSLNLNIQIPIIGIQLHTLLQLNFGSLSIDRQSVDQYSISVTERQSLKVQEDQILGFAQGNKVSLLNIKPQTVNIQLCHLTLGNVFKMLKFVNQFIKSPLIPQFKKLDPIVEQEVMFEGKFMLNQFATPQNMILKGNYLRFYPSNQSIYLLRTKMYPIQKKGQYGLIFREEVQKQINIVLMGKNKKLMQTLFQTLKQHMLYICTIAQWKKYYQKFSDQIIYEISEIQKQQQNTKLIDLNVNLKHADIFVGSTKLGETIINLKQFKGTVNYKQYNTDAQGQIGGLNITVGKQKLIQNLAIAVKYSYIEFMSLMLRVMTLRLNIQNYGVIEQIVNISAEYAVMVDNLTKSYKAKFGTTQQVGYVQERVPNPEDDIQYLLQSNVSIKLSNIEAYIIGFRNMIKNASLEISKYRNSPIPNTILKVRQIILMSCFTLTGIQFSSANNKIDLTMYNLGINLSFQLLLYELTAGRGNQFLNSVLNLIQTQKSIQAKQSIDVIVQQRPLPTVNVNVKGIKTRFKLTEQQQISTFIQNVMVKVNKNQVNKNQINVQLDWSKFGLMINNNVILQPISGKICLRCSKQGFPLAINANVQPIIVNISVHKLIESALVIKILMERILGLELVKSMLMEKLVAKNPGINSKMIAPEMELHVESVRLILFNHIDWQLIRLKVDCINLDTKRGKDNQIQVSLEHLNSIFRIYEPVLEKTKIFMAIKDGPQACIQFQDVRFNISQELVKDLIKQLAITKERVEQAFLSSNFHTHEQVATQNQLQKLKKIIVDMIVPQQTFDQPEQQTLLKVQQKINTSLLLVKNCLYSQVLVQVRIDDQKTQLHLKDGDPPGEVVFKIKSQYRQSYQMVQKYKRVIIKLSLIHPIFSTQSLYFSVFLHKQAYSYQKATFYDDTGLEVYSAVGLYIHQQANSSNYLLHIVSPFKIVNTTTLNVNLNWVVGQDVLRKELNAGQSQWVSPWVPEKVTINPNSQHIYASSYQIKFAQPHGLYEISLNNNSGVEAHNYCCLTVERQLFQLSPDYSHQHISSHVNTNLPIAPATISIKPTYFVINHFHSQIIINQTECRHKEKVPLYSMFRYKNQSFFKIKLGDGSMHEVYLPKDGQSAEIQLKLKNQNYIKIFILRAPSLQGTKSPNSNQCIYHIYGKLQLLISFPKDQDINLVTSIYATKYVVKKQVQLNQVQFQHIHPSLINGHEGALTRDRFRFHSYFYILGELQKYLQIKTPHFYCKQVTLYPSYYGTDLFFYKQPAQEEQIKEKQKKQQKKQEKQVLFKKFSINYEFTKINQQITMFYVSILPKYYVLNESQQHFNIDGQGVLKFNERIVVDSDDVQVVYIDNTSNWQMLHTSLCVNLSDKKDMIFFRSILFKEHQINQALKIRKRRKRSRSLGESEINQLLGGNSPMRKEKEQEKNQNLQQSKKLQVIQQDTDEVGNKIIIDSSNIRIFQILKHIGSYSATTFCFKEWQEWIDIHNNLNKTLIAATSYAYEGLQISIQTTINPGEVGKHPYGTENMPKIKFYIIGENQKLQLGTYETTMRLNDQIQITHSPIQGNEIPATSQLVVMYEVRKKKGRKVIFSFTNQTKNKKNLSLIIPAFLKISESLKITVESLNASIICGKQKYRKQLIRLCSRNIDLLLLVYPSGLYLFQAVCSLQLQAPHFPQYVLDIPNIQFYLQAVQSRFIERVTFKVPKQIVIFLTDKLLYEILDVAMRNIAEIGQTGDVFNNDPKLSKQQDTDGFYTSSLNSVSISEIHLKVTMKKVLIQGSENQQKILDMGLSIAELEKSGIKLSKVDIQQPINTKHLNNITKMYVMEIIVGCLGGMNLIGNPKQFMEEIQAGRMRGKPVIGFIGGVLAGTANSMSKIISTVSNGVSTLSMDYEFQRQRNQYYMTQPQGLINGLKQGTKSLATSLKSGIVGLVQKPYSGAKQQGGIGFLKGSFQGLVGLIVKPVAGLMDATSLTIQGIRSASSYQKQDQFDYKGLEKPLYHKFKIIRPYDRVDQLAYNSLTRILKIEDKHESETVDIVEAVILEDEQGKPTEEAVLVTADKTYVINFCQDLITMQFRNEKMVATGKFLQGVVLYLDLEQGHEGDVGQYRGDVEGGEVVFRVCSNAIKKQRLYWTLKSFVNLYTQSKDSHQIPD